MRAIHACRFGQDGELFYEVWEGPAFRGVYKTLDGAIGADDPGGNKSLLFSVYAFIRSGGEIVRLLEMTHSGTTGDRFQ